MAMTGLSAAAARGQADPAGTMVICRGLTVVTILVDGDGTPVEAPHICPDASLSLFVALAGASGQADPRVLRWVSVTWLMPDQPARAEPSRIAQARGPPSYL